MRTDELAALIPASAAAGFREAAIWRGSPKLQWPELILEPESVRSGASMLSRNEKDALSALLRGFGAAAVEEEKLVAEIVRLTPLSGAEARDGLYRLQTAGIVFAVRRAWGERLLFLPKDAFAAWQKEMFPCPLLPLDDGCLVRESPSKKFRRPLGRQLLAAFAELARCGLELTAKGVPPKKTLQKIERALDAESAVFARLGGPARLAEPYTPAEAFVLDTALRLGLVAEGDGKHRRWREGGLRHWLELPNVRRERELYGCVAEQYAYADRLTAHAASALEGLEPLRWFRTGEMVRWLQTFSPAGGGHEEPEAVKNRLEGWLEALCAFGWMQRGTAADGEPVFRWCLNLEFHGFPEGAPYQEAEPEPLIMLDDGELLAPPSADYRVLWMLELVAERVSEDVISVYRLSRASVQRAIASGWSGKEAASFLEMASGNPLPPVVRSSLAEWGGEYTGEAKSAAVPYPLMESCAADPGRAGLDRKWGAAAEVGIGDEPAEPLLPDPLSVRGLPLSAPRPPLEILGRQVEQLPVMWLQQFRSYHPSTRRELLERALSIQAPVQLKLEGRIAEFVPQQVIGREAEWSVAGYLREGGAKEPVTLVPAMWEEMKLLLPE